LAGNAGEEKLSGVGGPDATRPFCAVEREGIDPDFLAPERLFEALAQGRCPLGPSGGVVDGTARVRQDGAGPPRGVYVALDLAQGTR